MPDEPTPHELEDEALSLRDHPGYQRMVIEARERTKNSVATLRNECGPYAQGRANGALDELEWVVGYAEAVLARMRRVRK